MAKNYTISSQLDYVVGYLRYGHKEMVLSEEEYNKFKSLNIDEQKQWLKEEGELIIDDFEVNDFGKLGEIEINIYE